MSVPLDMRVITRMQLADARLQAIWDEFLDWFQTTKLDEETKLLLYRV